MRCFSISYYTRKARYAIKQRDISSIRSTKRKWKSKWKVWKLYSIKGEMRRISFYKIFVVKPLAQNHHYTHYFEHNSVVVTTCITKIAYLYLLCMVSFSERVEQQLREIFIFMTSSNFVLKTFFRMRSGTMLYV